MEIVCSECKNRFIIDERFFKDKKNRNGVGSEYCSRKCSSSSRILSVVVNCKNCNLAVSRRPSELKKSDNVFCSRSCSATYNNVHKVTGNRRSKMEIWIEEELKKKYDFEIVFNGKEAINSELDIYIPSLKLAFELNGIFHYEAIYGEEKLKSVVNNDNRKFQACLENKIELCVIDASGSKKFKPERDKKYLDIIENIINSKSGISM